MLASTIFLLSGCQIQTVEHFEEAQQQQEKSIAVEHTQNAVQEESHTNEQPVEQQTEPKEQTIFQSASERLATEQQTKEDTQSPVAKPTEENKTQQPSTRQEQQQIAQSPPKKESSEANTTATKKPTVTIAIDVTTLLQEEHYQLLPRNLQSEKYVPKDGVILKPTTYEIIQTDETVFDILKRATREHHIQLEYQGADENMYDSVYIEGIHYLYEFSAGNLSGWMYEVNKKAPNYGASQYKVQDGDVIRWRYTVDLGRDLDGVVRE